MFELYLEVGIVVLVYYISLFLISVLIKRNDIVDVGWGLGFILVSIYLFLSNDFHYRSALVYLLVLIWGLRISIHIYLRNSKKKEDFRYENWRKKWGKYFYLRSFFQVYLLQCFLLLMMAAPLITVSIFSQQAFNCFNFIGLILFLIGFIFEAVSDWQLAQFVKRKQPGEIMEHGLWQYSRHPNYFGEVTLWWGIFLVSISNFQSAISIVAPITITILILYISGVPLLENKYKGNKQYEEYKKRTNKFLPGPRKAV